MKRYQLVIFKIMKVAFGVRADQIAEIFNPAAFSHQDSVVYSFDQVIPFGKKGAVRYMAPKIITSCQSRGNYGIKIEAPEDIIFERRENIKPIPALIARQNISKAFYGVVTPNTQPILLIDFFRLLDEAKQRC